LFPTFANLTIVEDKVTNKKKKKTVLDDDPKEE
jgi:hypothetical protein